MKILSQPYTITYDYLDQVYLSYFKSYQTGICLKPERISDVKTVTNGKVIYASMCNPFIGNLVVIEHCGKLYRYAHLDTICVSLNQIVKKTDIIGTIGDSLNNKNISYLMFDILNTNSMVDKYYYSTDNVDLETIKAISVNPHTIKGVL